LIEHPCDSDLEPKKSDPLENQAEVVANGCEDRIDGVALFMGEVIAVHSMAGIEVTNHRSDGCAAFHLAFHGGRNPPFLACGKDPVFVT